MQDHDGVRIYHSSHKPAERLALIEEARRVGAKHHITFAFNAHYVYGKAIERLQRWDRMLVHRLYRRNAFELPDEEVFRYVLFPEHGLHIHFHGVIAIPEHKLGHFCRIAEPRWKACVPTGNLHFGEIRQPVGEGRDWLAYITKSSTAVDYVTSAFLRLPKPHRDRS